MTEQTSSRPVKHIFGTVKYIVGVAKISQEAALDSFDSDLVRFAVNDATHSMLEKAANAPEAIPKDITRQRELLSGDMYYQITTAFISPAHLRKLEEAREEVDRLRQELNDTDIALNNTLILLEEESKSNTKLRFDLAMTQQPWWKKVLDWLNDLFWV